MKLIDTIIQDWKQNWGTLLSTMGLFVLVGMVSYNAGITNGMVQLCTSDNGTLVEHISGRIYCEYQYIEPSNDWDINTTLNLGDLQWHTT